MSSSAAPPFPARGRRAVRALRDLGFWALLGVLGLATAVVACATDGNVGAAVAATGLVGLLYAVWRAPLRWTALAVTFLLLTLDDHLGGGSVWRSPLYLVGDLLKYNLDMSFAALHGFKLSGLELLLMLVAVIVVHRRSRGVAIDTHAQVPPAALMRDGMVLFVLGVGLALLNGLATGGTVEVAIWQTRPLLLVVLLYLFYVAAFRGPLDHRALARMVVAAALVRGLLATFIARVVAPATLPPSELPINCATSHGDSVLFTVAVVILVLHFLEQPDRGRLISCLLFLPPILLGMKDNNRRLVWVELGFSALAIFAASGWSWWKRGLTRSAIVAAPLLALYVAAGWSSEGRIFRPVQTLRGMVDHKTDRSAWDRETENWNIAATLQLTPLLGRGFGQEWLEIYKMDDITQKFPQYHAEPHNQVLGLVLFAGPLGFTAIWSILAFGIFLAVRSARRARDPVDRTAAFACLSTCVVTAVQSYGDLGLMWVHTRVLLALALCTVAKLAVTTGAWPHPRRRAPAGVAG